MDAVGALNGLFPLTRKERLSSVNRRLSCSLNRLNSASGPVPVCPFSGSEALLIVEQAGAVTDAVALPGQLGMAS